MFEELDKLSDGDAIKVCHAVYAAWDKSIGVKTLLPDDLAKIADSIIDKYSNEYREKLTVYIKKRTTTKLTSNSQKSVTDFFNKFLTI